MATSKLIDFLCKEAEQRNEEERREQIREKGTIRGTDRTGTSQGRAICPYDVHSEKIGDGVVLVKRARHENDGNDLRVILPSAQRMTASPFTAVYSGNFSASLIRA